MNQTTSLPPENPSVDPHLPSSPALFSAPLAQSGRFFGFQSVTGGTHSPSPFCSLCLEHSPRLSSGPPCSEAGFSFQTQPCTRIQDLHPPVRAPNSCLARFHDSPVTCHRTEWAQPRALWEGGERPRSNAEELGSWGIIPLACVYQVLPPTTRYQEETRE